MPSSTRPATPGPSNVSKNSKRAMSDVDCTPQDSKKARRNSPAEPSTRCDSNRDTKRRRKRKKKAPVVSVGTVKNEATQGRLDERSRAPLSAQNEIIRFASAPSEVDLPAGIVSATKFSFQAPSSKSLSKSRQGSSHSLDKHRSQAMPSTLVRTTKSLIRLSAYPPNRMVRTRLFQRIHLCLRLPLVRWRIK